MKRYVVVEVDNALQPNVTEAVANALREARIEALVSTNDGVNPLTNDSRGNRFVIRIRKPDPAPVDYIKELIP